MNTQELRQEWFVRESQETENEVFHRPLSAEYAFWRAVATGDIEYVRRECKENRFIDTGRGGGVGCLSRDPLINLKYHHVISTAIITRVCVDAGMSMEQAFRLSDFYILKLDNAGSMQAVERIHDQMVMDFTGKMQRLSKKPETSKPVAECMEYIYANIQKRVTVEDLAAFTGLSPSHLSRLFKKEIGISVSDYIREKKVEKAQELLQYSDFSLIKIATDLAFSSQSHFTQVFHDFTGMTPKKYRDTHSDADRLDFSHGRKPAPGGDPLPGEDGLPGGDPLSDRDPLPDGSAPT
ncbi:MAG: helix-turn-helix domain-containing protein [Subdoligranulum sp.]|nr:helix-turn-helix domain-containing protein [Subdoligranulum sp.]